MTGSQESPIAAQRVAELLIERFSATKVLTWRDVEAEHADSLNQIVAALGQAGLELVIHRVVGDEFGIKHRVYAALDEVGAANQRHLVYRTGEPPPPRGNWLLDIEIGYGQFAADTTSLLVHDLCLDGYGLDDVVAAHIGVFDSAVRTEQVRAHMADLDADAPNELLAANLQAVMSASVLGIEGIGAHRLHRLVESLLADLADGSEARYNALVAYHLNSFLWSGVARIYGYAPTEPSVEGLTTWLFDQAWRGWPDATNATRIDFERLRGERNLRTVFDALATYTQASLNIADRLRAEQIPVEDLAQRDVFPVVDDAVLGSLGGAILDRSLPLDRISELVRTRSVSTWFDRREASYRAVEWAAQCLTRIEGFAPDITDPGDGIRRYAEDWSRIDRAYRTFRYYVQRAEEPIPSALIDRVERAYVTDYQRRLASEWQEQIDRLEAWRIPDIRGLEGFSKYDLPDKRKTLVIISDALRYEVGTELADRMNADDWFTATVEPRLSPLPSYTQLGMASHLPHNELKILDTRLVRADERPTDGTPNRAAVWADVNVAALTYGTVTDMRSEELAALWSTHDAVVVYHDVIDAIGDKATSERSTPRAASDALDDIVKLIRRFGKAKFRASRVLVTADHGFLFQDSEVEPIDTLIEPAHGDEIVAKNRRYVLGRGLRDHPAFTTWTSAQLGLSGDLQVQIPRSLSRLRLPGAGLRFVHGGATLQEIVVPLVTVTQSRSRETSKVEMAIGVGTSTVTTSEVLVTLTQKEPVTGKRRGRTFRVGVWAGDELLSGLREITADSDSHDIRDRHMLVELVLDDRAGDFNGKSVEIRAEEKVNESYVPCGLSTTVTLQRGFGGFFDAL